MRNEEPKTINKSVAQQRIPTLLPPTSYLLPQKISQGDF